MAARAIPLVRQAPVRHWAFLVYIAGDNNLSDEGLSDIEELCKEGTSPDVYVGVEIDTKGEHTGSIRYEITEPDVSGDAHRTVIQRLPEKDSGDPRTLQSFVRWGLKRYPAESVLLAIWGHGSGFRGRRRAVAYDDFGSTLDMPEIDRVLQRCGVNRKRPIAILGFDACLMSMLEIAHHFRGKVRILVGSQQTEPGQGWPYDRVLAGLKRCGDPEAVANEIVDAYMKRYRRLGISNVTQSAILIDETEACVRALHALGHLLARGKDRWMTEIRRVRLFVQSFAMADYVDLIDLTLELEHRIGDGRIQAAARRLREAAGECVLSAEPRSKNSRAHGLSVWFPATRSVYFANREKYLELKCNKRGRGWVAFLDAIHA